MAGAVYIRWMCLKDKFKFTDSKLVNRCSQNSDFNPDTHEFRYALVTAKAKATPLVVLTIPRRLY